MKHTFGLIGYPLGHSWSPSFFQQKFQELGLNEYSYQSFPFENLDRFMSFINTTPNLFGLNVTIPYKEAVIPFLDLLDPAAKEIGAVNTIVIQRSGTSTKLIGYNTDAEGFILSSDFSDHQNALILGTGGASKAVAYALEKMGIAYTLVSRDSSRNNVVSYDNLTEDVIARHTLIINTTHVGMFPGSEEVPALPYHWISSRHFLYDLVYNPEITGFMKQGMAQGAQVQPGLIMLHQQAELSLKLFLDH